MEAKQLLRSRAFSSGGENDVRGFYDWTISPIVYLPSDVASVNVYNADGTLRTQKGVQVTMPVPSYQVTFPGGDTNVVGNFEYRIPIVGPVTLAIFADAGLDTLLFPNQLRLNPGRLAQLNQEFPEAGFTGTSYVQPGSEMVRTSTGLELQVLMPVVNAPVPRVLGLQSHPFRRYPGGAGGRGQIVFPEYGHLQ